MLSNEPKARFADLPAAPETKSDLEQPAPLVDERLPKPDIGAHRWEHPLRDLEETAREVDRIADGLGRGVDAGIKDALTGLLALGISTQSSCEGHLDHGAPFPNVDIGERARLPMTYEKQRDHFAERLASIRVPFADGISAIGTFGIAALIGRAHVTPESIEALDRGDFRLRHADTWQAICLAHLESVNDCMRRNETRLAPEEIKRRERTASLYDSVESLVTEYNLKRSADALPPEPDARVMISGSREHGFGVSAGMSRAGETVSEELLRERQAEMKRFAEFLFEKHSQIRAASDSAPV